MWLVISASPGTGTLLWSWGHPCNITTQRTSSDLRRKDNMFSYHTTNNSGSGDSVLEFPGDITPLYKTKRQTTIVKVTSY